MFANNHQSAAAESTQKQHRQQPRRRRLWAKQNISHHHQATDLPVLLPTDTNRRRTAQPRTTATNRVVAVATLDPCLRWWLVNSLCTRLLTLPASNHQEPSH